jgi:hypothetical protein
MIVWATSRSRCDLMMHISADSLLVLVQTTQCSHKLSPAPHDPVSYCSSPYTKPNSCLQRSRMVCIAQGHGCPVRESQFQKHNPASLQRLYIGNTGDTLYQASSQDQECFVSSAWNHLLAANRLQHLHASMPTQPCTCGCSTAPVSS